jgi:hypothetical protein
VPPPEITPEQALSIDMKLPPEVWAYTELDDLLAALFRLTYATGFQDGQEYESRRLRRRHARRAR